MIERLDRFEETQVYLTRPPKNDTEILDDHKILSPDYSV
jgi:hypothetical protein